jgi:hydroxymethylpyrimidine/phosphomethylpyrimidine kinase
MSAPLLASIGTTHPWNIAGVGLDARVAAEFGVRHAAAIAGVTAQDEGGMRGKCALPAAILQAQLEALPENVTAFRIGALFDAQNVEVVAQFLRTQSGIPVVVDPVLGASLGGAFADAATYDALRAGIFTLPVVLTPNVPEAQRLTGRTITTQDELLAAAREILAYGPHAVLLKGGHLPGDPVDVLITADELHVLADTRLEGSMRGSGCVLAAALACELAAGKPLLDAVETARAYVRKKIAAQTYFGPIQVAF